MSQVLLTDRASRRGRRNEIAEGRVMKLERRPRQVDRVIALLRSRSPRWVPVWEILRLGVAQFSARIFEARHRHGFVIENKVEIIDGQKHSWYRLVENAPSSASAPAATVATQEQLPIAGELCTYADPEEM